MKIEKQCVAPERTRQESSKLRNQGGCAATALSSHECQDLSPALLLLFASSRANPGNSLDQLFAIDGLDQVLPAAGTHCFKDDVGLALRRHREYCGLG